MWFNSMETAQGGVPMVHNKEKERDAEEAIRHTNCETNCEDAWKWIATGWRQAIQLSSCMKLSMATNKMIPKSPKFTE